MMTLQPYLLLPVAVAGVSDNIRASPDANAAKAIDSDPARQFHSSFYAALIKATFQEPVRNAIANHTGTVAAEDKRIGLENGHLNNETLAMANGTGPAELDTVRRTSGRGSAMSSLQSDSNRLVEVRAALTRMRKPDRLVAVPPSPRCVLCQEAAEKTPWHEIETGLPLAA
jgi:hypothetical protein